MAAFYIDNCLPVTLAKELIALHHTAHTTRGRSKGRAGDDEQLIIAKRQGEILLTANRRDFYLLHDAWHRWSAEWGVYPRPQHCGVLVIPQQWDPPLAAHEIDLFLAGRTILPNEVHRYRPGASWEQRLPMP